jgi:Leucine-rich repeat (LRR) protein
MTAYSHENLNLITGKLILLYKRKSFAKIREIANRISKYIPIEEEKDARCFSRLIILYHPDKGEQFRKEIQQHFAKNDYGNLANYSHIFLMADIDNITVSTIDKNIDYRPEYVWDSDTCDGFDVVDTNEDIEPEEEYAQSDIERSFYNMIKIREYGRINVEFPPYYLEDFEEFEMAYCGLESLDGVEYCIHVKILDVSNNALSDLSCLWDLENLEELYLANNQIGYVDDLSNLINLRVLDISYNQIDDVSTLFELPQLEFVNLMGNPVPHAQITKLQKKGIIVMSDGMGTSKN